MPQLGLVGMWRVTAKGVDSDTWLRLGDGAAILAPDCDMEGGWLATETEFVADVLSWGGPCATDPTESAVWLTSASSYRPLEAGWELLAADGSLTATLTDDGWPKGLAGTNPDLLEAPSVTGALLSAYEAPATLPDGLVAAAPLSLVGEWAPVGPVTEAKPYLRFSDHRRVFTSDGCNDSSSSWLITDGGGFVTTGFVSTAVGCDGFDVTGALHTAVTLATDGDGLLHLLDKSGADIATFSRE